MPDGRPLEPSIRNLRQLIPGYERRVPPHASLGSRAGTAASRIGDIGAGCRDDQYLVGQRLEIGPEMDRALERQNARRGRLDAEMRQDCAIGRLQAARGHRNRHSRRAERAQQGHRPKLHPVAAIHRPGRGEAAAAQP